MFDQFIRYTPWDNVYFGNTLFDYTAMALIFFVSLLFLHIIRTYCFSRFHYYAEKTKARGWKAFEKVAGSVSSSFIAYLAVYLASLKLDLGGVAEKALAAILAIWITYQIIASTKIIVDHQIVKLEEKDEEDKAALRMVHFIINVVLGAMGLLWALSSFGINITSIIAGIGVSSVVIAFAAQNILGDLFSSLSIFIDKPFVVGDSITVGLHTGTVEKIGMKTTRLRGLQGEELIISNKELTSARIQNFKKMTERRVAFSLKISMETSGKKLRNIPGWMKTIVESQTNVHFDRCHFKNILDNAYEFETVYFVKVPEYSVFMDTQQEINLAFREKLEKEKITFSGTPAPAVPPAPIIPKIS